MNFREKCELSTGCGDEKMEKLWCEFMESHRMSDKRHIPVTYDDFLDYYIEIEENNL